MTSATAMTEAWAVEPPVNSRVIAFLRISARVFALVAVGGAGLVLVGWVLNINRLKSVLPDLVAMNPATAVAFILAGTAVWLETRDDPPQRLIRLLGTLVATIGIVKLSAVALGLPSSIDQVLFRSRLEHEAIPNRMAPNTALGFVLLGTSLALKGLLPRRAALASQVPALVVVAISLLALIGYAYSATRLYDVGDYIPMAMHTAALFLLLSLGVLFSHPGGGMTAVIISDLPAGVLARRLLPVAMVVPALSGWLWLEGANRQWFPTDMGVTLVALANTLFFTALLWWQMAMLRRSDLLRKFAEIEITRKHRALEESSRAEREAYQLLKQTQSQLVQSEKLSSLGQMVAGVAHEINNPLSFVSNNVAVMQRDFRDVSEALGLLRKLESASDGDREDLRRQIRELVEQIDLDYCMSNLPELLMRSREGLRRIQQIVKDLRDFARLDQSDLHDADINAGITSTINIIQGHAKKKQVKIETQFGALPPIQCHPAKINQVVMNLLSNAIDASREGGDVTVETRMDGNAAFIAVKDSGAGIDPAIRDRIFDPFFTTKPLGQGTGLGLSISYGIVKDHGGDISVQSTPGSGSCFTVRLPIASKNAASPSP
jgi:signal transduction histidine kinase